MIINTFKVYLFLENIKLEHLSIRRLYVGQTFPMIVELIKHHSKTLKSIGKLGLSEAIRSFNSTVINLIKYLIKFILDEIRANFFNEF